MVLVVVCLCAQAATGQVRRVNAPGRALDANLRYGSGGRNTGGSSNLPDWSNSRLVANKQLSGLGSFRGNSVTAPNRLRLNLPSSRLERFNRQSVSVRDVIGGQVYKPNPYLNRSSTTFNATELTTGITRLRTPVRVVAGSSSRFAADVDDFKLKNVSARPGRQGTSSLRIPSAATPGLKAPAMPGLAKFAGAPEFPDHYVSLGDLPVVPGIVRPHKLMEELRELDEDTSPRVDWRVDSARTDATKPKGDVAEDQLSPGMIKLSKESEFQQPFSSRGQVLGELQRAIDFRRKTTNRKSGGVVSLPGSKPAPGRSGAVRTSRGGDITLQSFAGRGQDTYSRRMRRAETMLKKGHYYKSAEQYTFAFADNPNDPLARMGLAHAMFAAGESSTAADHLYSAIRQLPGLARVRSGVLSKVRKNVMAEEMVTLEKRLAAPGAKSDPRLVMLAAYVYQNTGNTQKAYQSAIQLKALAGKDDTYKAFAELILRGSTQSAPIESPGDGAAE